MSNFKMIEKLGLEIIAPYRASGTEMVRAEDLEDLLQSAQVVYGHVKKGTPNWWGPRENGQFDDTHTALIIGITPIKKKTKVEAALEFVASMAPHMSEAKRILEMKDEV